MKTSECVGVFDGKVGGTSSIREEDWPVIGYGDGITDGWQDI